MKTVTSLTLAAATFVLLAVAAPPAFGQEVKPEVEKVKKEYAAKALDKAAMKCKEMAAGDEEAAKKCEEMYAADAMKGCGCGEEDAEKCEAMHAEYMAMAEADLAKAAEKCEAMAAEGDAEGAEACEAKVAEHRAKLAACGEKGVQCEMMMREHEHEMQEEAAEGKDEDDKG